MDTTTAQETDRILAELRKISGGLKDYSDVISKAKAESKLERDLAGREGKRFRLDVRNTSRDLVELGSGAQGALNVLRQLGRGGIVGAAIGGLVGILSNVTKTYQDLANSGHMFGGSILDMQRSAAAAGMPLQEFADATKASSTAIKDMGTRTFIDFQREMRGALVEHGNFAMSMAMVTKFQEQNLATLRLSGALQHTSSRQLSGNMVQLAETTANLSEATGVAKDKITEMANAALQGSRALSRVKMLPEAMRAQATHDMQMVTSVMAAQAGRAGEFMSNWFAETVGAGGFGEFSTQGQTLINAGLGHMVSRMNELSRNQTVDGAVAASNYLQAELERNMSTLQNSATAGNESARALIGVWEDMRRIGMEEVRRRATEQDGMTKFLNTIETVWNAIVGGFKEGLLAGFKPFADSLGDINSSQAMQRFGTFMKEAGEKVGGFIAAFLSEDNLKRVGDGITSLVGALSTVDWGALIGTVGVVFAGFINFVTFATKVFKGLAWVVEQVGKVIGILLTPFTLLLRGFNQLTGAVAEWPALFPAITAALIGFLAIRKLQRAFSSTMTVNAQTVIVNGAGGGGGGGFGGDDFGRRGRRGRGRANSRGRMGNSGMSRQQRIDRINARRAGQGRPPVSPRSGLGGGLGRGLGRAGLKAGIKKVPILGALAGLGFALQRGLRGDWAGAAMEAASGVAGSFPGLGTAASLGLDATLAARDSRMPTPPAGPSRGGRAGLVAGAVGGMAAGGATAYAMGAMGGEEAAATGEEGAPATPPENPQLTELIRAVNRLIESQHEGHEIMMGIARSQNSYAAEQLTAIRNMRGSANN